MLLIPSVYCPSLIQCSTTKSVEYVVADLNIAGESIRLICAYIPPSVTATHAFRHSITAAFSDLATLCPSDIPVLLAGDFNLPGISWDPDGPIGSSKIDFLFIDFLAACQLSQRVLKPTRGTNILDLACTNNLLSVDDIKVEPGFANSDHNTVILSINTQSIVVPSTPLFRNYYRTDFESLNAFFVNTNWKAVFHGCLSTDDYYNCFLSVVRHGIDQFVPLSRPRHAHIPSSIQKTIDYRNLLFKLPRTPERVSHIAKLGRDIVRKTLKISRRTEEKMSKTKNSVALYRYIKHRIRPSCSIPAIKVDDRTIFDDSSKCVEFSKYFHSVYEPDDALPTVPFSGPFDITTPAVIFDLLRYWKKSSANTSPDDVPYILIKRCAVGLALPVSLIFNVSFSTGTVPSIWKTSIVRPIFKKSDRSLIANYRPVSLTCSLSKICEYLINLKLIHFLFSNGLISPEQHGFLKGRSVTSNLLGTLDYVSQFLGDNVPVDVVYFDFQKAFDKVKLEILIRKLTSMGCPEYLISWISSFLANRSASVQIGNCKSESLNTPSGVPQGSVLGPTLFLIMINDLASFCHVDGVHCSIFADDVKIAGSCAADIQLFIDKLSEWSIVNRLPISPSKCAVLHLLPKHNPKHKYYLNGTPIDVASSPIRDLGILISDTLSWDDHIKHCSRKASAALYCLLKAVKSNKPEVLTRLYTVYVRPLLEFSTPVFNPTKKRQIKALESVQKSATRRIYFRCPRLRCDLPSANYQDRLNALGLQSLRWRRRIFDLKYYHQVLIGEAPRNVEIITRKSITRGSSNKVVVPKFKGSVRKSFFSCRAPKSFLTLPRSMQSISKHTKFVSLLARLTPSTE